MENKPFSFNSIFMFLFSIVFNSFKFFLIFIFSFFFDFYCLEFIWNHLLVFKVSNLDWSKINLALKRWGKSLTTNTLVKLGLFDLEKAVQSSNSILFGHDPKIQLEIRLRDEYKLYFSRKIVYHTTNKSIGTILFFNFFNYTQWTLYF